MILQGGIVIPADCIFEDKMILINFFSEIVPLKFISTVIQYNYNISIYYL